MKKNQKGSVIVILLVIIVILLVGAAIFGYMFLQNPKKYLVDNKIKPDTSTEESIKDKLSPRTEIKESGMVMEVLVSPSDNNTISGTVTITASDIDPQAAGVGFFLSETPEELEAGGIPSLGIDRDASDGWSNVWDTTDTANGKYYINVVAFPPGGEGNPLGVAQVPVEIKN